MIYRKYVKRIFDLIFAILALIILSPILLVTAILVHVKLGSPVIFAQERPGYKEKIFRMYKFRTMTNEKDEKGKLLPDEKRLTSFGRFLRKTSLDELPELVNIVKGDMSIIGPRALLVSYLPYYTPEQRRRHDVVPGLVGLAALHGRNNQSWDDKFKYDIKYVDNISFRLDCKILFGAVGVVFKREGVNLEGYATTENFIESVKKKETVMK